MTASDPQVPPGDAAPQVYEERVWIDGCFDFFHHGNLSTRETDPRSNVFSDHTLQGHAGAIVQARQLGSELYIGVHSDEAILENKGPTVMTLQERFVWSLLDRSFSA